jgi:hypothetical protein
MLYFNINLDLKNKIKNKTLSNYQILIMFKLSHLKKYNVFENITLKTFSLNLNSNEKFLKFFFIILHFCVKSIDYNGNTI